jgi:hypothetical protein
VERARQQMNSWSTLQDLGIAAAMVEQIPLKGRLRKVAFSAGQGGMHGVREHGRDAGPSPLHAMLLWECQGQ